MFVSFVILLFGSAASVQIRVLRFQHTLILLDIDVKMCYFDLDFSAGNYAEGERRIQQAQVFLLGTNPVTTCRWARLEGPKPD